MENKNVIPAKDSDFDVLQDKIYTQCTAHAVGWNIPPASVAALLPYKTSWDEAWAIARDFDNRTPVDTSEKDLARAAYEAVLRPFIKSLYINPTMTTPNLEACGLRPHETTKTPIPVPATLPVISILPDFGHRVKVYFKQQPDANGVSKRGKPDGVQFCEFAFSVGEMPARPEDCAGKKLVTRSPEVAEFEMDKAGQKLYCFARWINPKGEAGPWSDMYQSFIP